MTRHPIPAGSLLDGFEPLGFIAGGRRCRSHDGRHIYTWDARHGEVEVFDRRGRHLGAIDPLTGAVLKDAVRGRWIEV